MMTRMYLALMALLFAAFGLMYFIQPVEMSASLGVDVSGPNGAYELRGVYGGISLAAALLFASGALRPALRQPALWFIVTYMGGYVFARAAALLFGPPPTPFFASFIIFEVVNLVIAALALRATYKP
jgi:hypothetical protein